MNRQLQQHLNSIRSILAAYYDASKTWESPVDIGTLREVFVRELLLLHLPSGCEIESGEILDHRGTMSRQQDCMVYRKDFPKLALGPGPRLLFAEGVKATVEVKSKLTWSAFKQAWNNVLSVKQLQTKIHSFATGEKTGYMFCYVFAYEGPTDDTVVGYYNRFVRDKGWTMEEFFHLMPDALYVLNGPLFYKNDGWAFRKMEGGDGTSSPFIMSTHPVSFNKFFVHMLLAVTFPDIYTISWEDYLNA